MKELCQFDYVQIVKDILYYACIVAIVCILIYMYVASRPLKSENLSCEYKDKQDKIVCTQMGDVVPEWLDLNKNMIFIFTPQKTGKLSPLICWKI